MTTVLFWDIDGTLLSTARAGIFALEEAAREVLGESPDFSQLKTAGLTDWAIAQMAIETVGQEATLPRIEEYVTAYERHLPTRLPLRKGTVLPNVRKALEAFAPRDDVLSLLLTGNTRAGARAKLSHYGLVDFFDDGAFSADQGTREDIAHRARGVAANRLGTEPDPDRTYVIGDTPHDIACGKAIGARTLAVATGTYPLDELRAEDPWAAVDQLPEPGPLGELLELAPLPTRA